MLSMIGRVVFPRVVLLVVGVVALCAQNIATASMLNPPASQAQLGMNLSGPADWNTELPFADVFHLSRPWISQREGAKWGEGPKLELDEHGWVKKLEPGCWAETLMCTIHDGGHYPAGEYTVLYEGEGKIEFRNVVSVTSSAPGRIVIDVNPAQSNGPIYLKVVKTNPRNYIRNIKVIMPGLLDTYQSNPWRPGFLNRWRGITCFRFMDWMQTNGSTVETWRGRPTPASATFMQKGIPLELMIDLCNRQKADAWFCVPHRASDEYVRRFAQMVKSKLEPGLKVYVEYSNEVWNGRFPQHGYAEKRAADLGLGPPERPWEGAGMYYARRSVEIFRIWEDVFGEREGLVRVLAWQAGNTWWMNNIVLTHEDAYKHADALAIAPYMGMIVHREGDGLTAREVSGWTVDQVLDYLERHALPHSIEAIEASKKVADNFGLALIAYEGGQHMVGVSGAQENDALTALFQAANKAPRIGKIYAEYYDAWTEAGGGLFCYFTSISRWSKWGSWGIMQYYDDAPLESPKFMATMKWGRRCGQALQIPHVAEKRKE